MIRNKYTGLYILAVLSFFAAGCYKDNGNYDYKDINVITLSDTATIVRREFKLNDKLELQPVIKQTLNTDESNLEYHWLYYEEPSDGGNSAPIKLPDTKKLELTIAPPFVLGRNYRIISEVKDKNTGISAYLYYFISVVNEFTQGWILMEDKAGKTELSLILPDGRVLLGQSKPDIGKPVKLEITTRSISDDLSPAGRRLYAIGESNGFELDYQTLIKKLGYSDLFYEVPSPIKLEYINWPSSIGIAINNGIVHSNLTGGFPDPKRWGSPLLSTKGSFNYKVSPYVAGGIALVNGYTTYPSVVYDNTNKCFAYVGSAIGGAGAALTPFPTSASNTAIFDMNNVGMTMVYMDSANIGGEFNAVMKDDVNAPYLLRFKALYLNSASPVITLAKTLMVAPEVINMSAAAGATSTPHIFYTVANRLYRYETSSNTTIMPFSFPASETVTRMEYQQSAAGVTLPRLVVATWNGTEGKLYYFPLSSLGDLTTYSNMFTGFGKIVDIAYKVPGT